MSPVGGRNDDGYWDFGCRAMALLGQPMCLVMAANVRLTDTFELAQKKDAAGKSKATRTPRRRTRLNAEMGDYIAGRQA